MTVQTWMLVLNFSILLSLTGVVWATRGGEINELKASVEIENAVLADHGTRITILEQQMKAVADIKQDVRAMREEMAKLTATLSQHIMWEQEQVNKGNRP